MLKSIKGTQPRIRIYSVSVDGTGAASLSGLDKHSLTLTDNGVGDYTLTFNKPFASDDFQVLATPVTADTVIQKSTKTISSVRILTRSETSASGASTAAAKAVANINTTTPIVLTASHFGDERNGTLFTLDIAAAAPNPTNTVLAVWSGSRDHITLTITPNDGTNNAATPVNITTAQIVEHINSFTVVGVNLTTTDAGNLRILQTATGGGAENVANGGEGDNLGSKVFSGGVDFSSTVAPVAAAAKDADFDVLIIGSDTTARY